MIFRPYEPDKDREAAYRIWRETGWLQKGKEEVMDLFVGSGRAWVAEMEGAAECLVTTVPGTIRYLQEELPFACVTGVTTSRVARKRGLARRLTARAIAEEAADGAFVVGLGMFEQGYYDQLGFGSGSYERWFAFDPAQLIVSIQARTPRRITADDWEKVHAARLRRVRGHGGCNLSPPTFTRAEMLWSENGFGLGYYDDSGERITHHLWFEAKEVTRGPYQVAWMSYQTPEQFLELMALIKNLEDQVRLVRMREPQGIQLQDLLAYPLTQRLVREKSKFEVGVQAMAYWQMRICDLAGCLAHTHLPGEPVRFNLKLTDPIENFLDSSATWRGVAGEYVVTLGPSSGVEQGVDPQLPTLTASVGAFTRMWLGVRPATGLAVTDQLAGPRELLVRLDRLLRLPEPVPDWEF